MLGMMVFGLDAGLFYGCLLGWFVMIMGFTLDFGLVYYI